VARTRTDIETPYVLETPLVIAPAKYPSYIARESDGVCSKTVSKERAPHMRLAPVHHRRGRRFNVLHIGEMGDRAKTWRRVGDRDTGRLGDGGGERC
jgi:hypothetical protein